MVGAAPAHGSRGSRRQDVGAEQCEAGCRSTSWASAKCDGAAPARVEARSLLLLAVADHWWQVRRVHLEVYTDNEPAIALYRKFGFEVEGTLRQDTFRHGEWVDTLVMGRLRG